MSMKLDFVKTIKKNYSLIPLVGLLGFGVTMCVFSSIRSIVKSPDAVINRRGNPKPYESYILPDGTAKQYKLFTEKDFSKIKVDPELRK